MADARDLAPDLNQLVPGVPLSRLLLLVRDASPNTVAWVQAATRGAVAGLAYDQVEGSMHFHGLPVGAGSELTGPAFPRNAGPSLALESGNGTTALLTVGIKVLWLAVSSGPAEGLQVWSGVDFLPPDHVVAEEKEIEGRLDNVLPLLAFLRRVHGNACWHNPHRHFGLVIDDPLLLPRYGCLDFPALLDSARQMHLHVTLAFIPWNARRTRTEDAALFLAQKDIFRLCLHGCDHTAREYRHSDPELLRAKTRESLRRMADLQQRTGMECDPLMVCPQEHFSEAAQIALGAESGVEAIVNSRLLPRDHRTGNATAADLLRPAFTSSFNSTHLQRFYPTEPWKIALGLLVGKPAILVAHHDDFSDGMVALEGEVRRLRRVVPALRSPSLIETVRQTHWRRNTGKGVPELYFFTRRFEFQHEGSVPSEITLIRRLHPALELRRATLDGREVPYTRGDGFFKSTISDVEPGRHRLELELVDPPAKKTYRLPPLQSASVFARRVASEFRDGFMMRSRLGRKFSGVLSEGLRLNR